MLVINVVLNNSLTDFHSFTAGYLWNDNKILNIKNVVTVKFMFHKQMLI